MFHSASIFVIDLINDNFRHLGHICKLRTKPKEHCGELRVDSADQEDAQEGPATIHNRWCSPLMSKL